MSKRSDFPCPMVRAGRARVTSVSEARDLAANVSGHDPDWASRQDRRPVRPDVERAKARVSS